VHGQTVDLDDGALVALGIHRMEVPVPFIEAGGPANAYAIEDADGRWTLFDTGIGTPDGLSALRAQASERGIDLKRLSRIVVSHGHLDHFGNAQQLSEESGARVFIHAADLDKVTGDGRFAVLLRRHRSYFLSALGVPVDVLDAVQANADRQKSSSVRHIERERLGTIEGGEVLEFKRFSAVVRHLPGHTPGLICLHAEREKVFFADDHVLARVSPNPLLDLSQGEGETKFRALARYIEGAKWVRDQDLNAVLPGHGRAFTGHRELLDGLFAFYEVRQEKLLNAIRAQGEASVFELLPTLFPRRDPGRLVLMLSEVLANLEVLEDRGRVTAKPGEIVRYTADVGSSPTR
jgi:glyoxylase-like metal-dependent hydrolase (beta-lactamase superfamily II)